MGESGLTRYQRTTLQDMARNPVPWCLRAQTRNALLRLHFIKPTATRCHEHGERMYLLTERGRRSVTSPPEDKEKGADR